MNPKDMNLNVKKYERNNRNNSGFKKDTQAYGYYSRVLKEPFDTVEELKKAEEAYYAKLKAKEESAITKKADAAVVENAFKALNTARRAYKDALNAIVTQYSADLKALKDAFEAAKAAAEKDLEIAETDYSSALKAFTEKYPEGYHLTLKDGDFETTICGSKTGTYTPKANTPFDYLEMLLGL